MLRPRRAGFHAGDELGQHVGHTQQAQHEWRDLALTVGRFGRAGSINNLVSESRAFGLHMNHANAEINRMLEIVIGWKEFVAKHGVEQRSIEMLEQAILPESFFRTPPDFV